MRNREAIDASVVTLMQQVRNKYVQQNQQYSVNCLLLEQKLIYVLLNNPSLANIIHLTLDQLVISFAQKVNKTTMEGYENEGGKGQEKYLNKVVAMLMEPEVQKNMNDQSQFRKLKILSFNNLSCIYKKKRKFGVALRAINYALKMEEGLLSVVGNQEKYDIIPTYLNKAAIFNQMKRHDEALETIKKARTHIEEIEQEMTAQIEKTAEEGEKKRLLEKRYYGMYMKMIIFYNMAAEKEHLHLRSQAIQYYKQSKQTAIIIDNQLMISKLTIIIQNLIKANS